MPNNKIVPLSDGEEMPIFVKRVHKDGDVNRIKELLFSLAKDDKVKPPLPSGQKWTLTITPQSEDK